MWSLLMSYRHYPPVELLLFGYDPARDLPADHLARLVDAVVEECVTPVPKPHGSGQPEFDPRLLVKVLVYGYATGVRSSRVMERLCSESLPYLFLTRGDSPSYHTLCSARVEREAELEAVWLGLFAVADACGLRRMGRITLDSTKMAADASPEAVLTEKEYSDVLEHLRFILAEAKERDDKEDREAERSEQAEDEDGNSRGNRLQKSVEPQIMRDILRRVRKERRQGKEAGQSDQTEKTYSARMLSRIEEACEVIEAAQETGEKFVCLTDPDARMMYGGRIRSKRECHSFEVAVDNDTGLLVAAQVTQEPNDNSRLLPLVTAAEEAGPVHLVDADSGYYSGNGVGALLDCNMDVCIPDTLTACDLHRAHRGDPVGTQRQLARGNGQFTYEEATDTYLCKAGMRLAFVQERAAYGQTVRMYRSQADCQSCHSRHECLVHQNAKHRTLKVGTDQARLYKEQDRFLDPLHQERYRHRAEQVETVFGFLRGTLGYARWMLRGKHRVACEASLFKLAYQVRKLYSGLQHNGQAIWT
jgi:transposase